MTGSICVYCRRQPVEPDWRPFCSERCKLLDLRNWIEGRYTVPGDPDSSLSSQNDTPDDHGADDTDSAPDGYPGTRGLIGRGDGRTWLTR